MNKTNRLKLIASTLFVHSMILSSVCGAEGEAKGEAAFLFTPHITGQAATREPYKVSIERNVGSNIYTNVLLSSLNISLLKRLEVGTAPFFYLSEDHDFNFSLKYNFWRGEEFIWAAGFSFLGFKLDTSKSPPPFTGRSIDYHITALQILLNYIPKWTHFRFGFMANSIDSQLAGDVEESVIAQSWRTAGEWGMDVTRSLNDLTEISVGLGSLREQGLTAEEEVRFGFGSSVRYLRPDRMISSPTLGLHYTPETGDFLYLFSTSIY